MFTRSFLKGLKRRALRQRLWYKALDSLDRGLFNLTCVVVDRVKSETLSRQILGIVLKLRDALKGEFVRLVESVGVARAWNAARKAVEWGNVGASMWKRDPGFARFHAVIEYHSPRGWGV